MAANKKEYTGDPQFEKKWTHKQMDEILKINVKGYSEVIAVAALYKKLYGKFPAIGLSGCQVEYINKIVEVQP